MNRLPKNASLLSFLVPDSKCLGEGRNRIADAAALLHGDLADALCNACRGQQSGPSLPMNPYVRRHLQRETQAAAKDAEHPHRDGQPSADEHPQSEIIEDPTSDPLHVQHFLMGDPLSAGTGVLSSGR